jgi:hypothetical protein
MFRTMARSCGRAGTGSLAGPHALWISWAFLLLLKILKIVF